MSDFSLDSAVAEQCRRMVDAIQIPDPFTVEELIQSVAQQRGVRIRAMRQVEPDPEISGVITQTKSGLISVSWPPSYEDSHPWWTWLCIGHELGHLMCGHLEKSRTKQGSGDVSRNRCVVGVDTGDEVDESAAEYFGTLLAARIEADTAAQHRRPRVVDLRGHDKVAGNFTRLLRG